MENKTAIDWLEQELERQCMIKVFAWEDEAYFRGLLEQAKQMEKEQSIKLIEIACMFQSASVFDEEIGKMTHEDVYNNYYK